MRTPLLATITAALLPVAAAAQSHVYEDRRPPGVVAGCGHYAVIGAARTLDGAFDLQNHLGATGSGVLDNDEVAQFRNGFHSVVFGPFGTRAQAADRVATWRDRAPDAYVKFGCVDGVPGAQDALHLSHGVYVIEGVSCASPPNAAVRVYSGTGFSGSATRDCMFKVEERQGSLYGGTNTCTDTYDGRRRATALSVRVRDANRFRLAENGRIEGDYRLCPALDPADFGG